MKSKMKYIGQIFLFLLFFSCQKFSWHNPYDPECPKDFFTPENFTAQLESKAIRISWQQSNTQISGFEILRSVDGGNNSPLISLGKEALSYLDTDVQADKQYKYFIVAKAGDNKSNELTTVIVFKVQPPIAPESLTANVLSTSKVQLQWVDKSTEETGFKIERKTTGGAYSILATVNANTTNHIDSTVAEGQTYIYRVYAFNQGGNSATYTNEIEIAVLLLPQVTTADITNITFNSASSGGSNIIQNGSSILAKGIVWSTAQNPTTVLSTKTSNGTGSGNFSGQMTGLTPGTTYYVRAYVTNQVGTAYGNEISFSTTQGTLPTVTTTVASNITMTSAQTGGNITNNGGYPVIARGVIWDLMPQPTISLSSKTNDGSGSGVFTSNMTGLANGTVYFARAYATTQLGTSYGSDISFKTDLPSTTPGSSVSDVDGNSYKTVIIGTQEWMSENLKTTKYNDGSAIQLIQVQSTWASFTGGAYSDYENMPQNSEVYGRLYNFYAVEGTKNVCPQGWRVPSTADWTTLENYLGTSLAARKLKSTSGWLGDGANGTNETGFGALPSGFRDATGFGLQGTLGYWWTNSAASSSAAIGILMSINSYLEKPVLNKQNGIAIRCIKN
jgi:uncharacterized protein (TIGR02145 family)